MSLISAGLKYIGRSINDALYRHDLKNVHNKSFNDKKAKINASRRKGYYINGAKKHIAGIMIKTSPLQKQSTITATSLYPIYNL